MADKKDKTQETKGGDQKKVAAKAPKAAAKSKAPAAGAKKQAAVPAEDVKKKRSRAHPDPTAEAAVS